MFVPDYTLPVSISGDHPILNRSHILIPLKIITIYFSYRSEMLLQRGKRILALEISSWLLVWVVEDFGLLSVSSLLYLQSHHMLCMDRRLWYHCPSLPERTAGWHITTQTQPYSGRQCRPLLAPQSHGPLFRVLLCLCLYKREKNGSPCIRAENNVHFLFGGWKW